jgi:hypothetical protein
MEILMIALLSGFGEEILFRGWLLPLVGYPISSLLFGILHFPMKKSLRIWTGFALLMGFVLGALVLLTDSIWTAACAHTLTNYLGFTIIMGLKTRKHHFIEAVEIEG